MPKKCESCKFHQTEESPNFKLGFDGLYHGRCALTQTVEYCTSIQVRLRAEPEFDFDTSFLELNAARDICDQEGNGIFVYFEPKATESGTTFDANCIGHQVSTGDVTKPGPSQLAMRAAA